MTTLKKLRNAILLTAWRTRYPRSAPHVVQKRCRDIAMLILANEDVGREIAATGAYEECDVAFLLRQIKPDDICVDVGANTGYYTLQMGAKAPAGSVHAFDPIPLNIHLIRASAELNSFANITANCAALSNETCLRLFLRTEDSAYSSFISTERDRPARTMSVTVTTLDSYLAANNVEKVNILKIDVEGSELGVLEGAQMTLKSSRTRPRVVLIELFSANLRVYGVSITDVLQFMRTNGYSPHYVADRTELLPYGSEHFDQRVNVFFLSEDWSKA
jgi:FkbM family methyltransferase